MGREADMNKNKHIFQGILLTVLSGIFAVFGIVIAMTQSLIAGAFIVIASSLFWGYTCLLSQIVELKLKKQLS